MTVDFNFKLVFKGTVDENKRMLNVINSYDNNSDVELDCVKVNETWISEMTDEDIESLAALDEITISAGGPYGKYEHLREVDIFKKVAECAPNATFDGEIYGGSSYDTQNMIAKLEDKLLKTSITVADDSAQADAWCEYFVKKITLKKFKSLFKVDGEDFDKDYYLELIMQTVNDYASLSEMPYDDFVDCVESIGLETDLEEEEYYESVNKVFNELNIEYVYEFEDYDGFENSEFIYDPIAKCNINSDGNIQNQNIQNQNIQNQNIQNQNISKPNEKKNEKKVSDKNNKANQKKLEAKKVELDEIKKRRTSNKRKATNIQKNISEKENEYNEVQNKVTVAEKELTLLKEKNEKENESIDLELDGFEKEYKELKTLISEMKKSAKERKTDCLDKIKKQKANKKQLEAERKNLVDQSIPIEQETQLKLEKYQKAVLFKKKKLNEYQDVKQRWDSIKRQIEKYDNNLKDCNELILKNEHEQEEIVEKDKMEILTKEEQEKQLKEKIAKLEGDKKNNKNSYKEQQKSVQEQKEICKNILQILKDDKKQYDDLQQKISEDDKSVDLLMKEISDLENGVD